MDEIQLSLWQPNLAARCQQSREAGRFDCEHHIGRRLTVRSHCITDQFSPLQPTYSAKPYVLLQRDIIYLGLLFCFLFVLRTSDAS